MTMDLIGPRMLLFTGLPVNSSRGAAVCLSAAERKIDKAGLSCYDFLREPFQT